MYVRRSKRTGYAIEDIINFKEGAQHIAKLYEISNHNRYTAHDVYNQRTRIDSMSMRDEYLDKFGKFLDLPSIVQMVDSLGTTDTYDLIFQRGKNPFEFLHDNFIRYIGVGNDPNKIAVVFPTVSSGKLQDEIPRSSPEKIASMLGGKGLKLAYLGTSTAVFSF